MKIRKGSAWREITGGKIYLNGSWRTITHGKEYFSGSWRNILNLTAPPDDPDGDVGTMTVTIDTPGGTLNVGTGTSINSPTLNAVPSGGKSPYTYQWSKASTDGRATYTINSPTSANTTVTASGLGDNGDYTCSVRVAVSDSTGLSATSVNIALTFRKEPAVTPPDEPIDPVLP